MQYSLIGNRVLITRKCNKVLYSSKIKFCLLLGIIEFSLEFNKPTEIALISFIFAL